MLELVKSIPISRDLPSVLHDIETAFSELKDNDEPANAERRRMLLGKVRFLIAEADNLLALDEQVAA